MARASTGGITAKNTRLGVAYHARFRAYGKRRSVLLGYAVDGMTMKRAETELANILADVRRGTWQHPDDAPPPPEPQAAPLFHDFAEQWFNRQLKINLATPVQAGGHLYGLGASRDYVCVEAATGKLKWSQGGFDAVASSLSDGHRVLVANDAGEVILLDANPEKYTELGRFQACGKTFSHPAYCGGVLYIRDSRELTAWQLNTSPSAQR